MAATFKLKDSNAATLWDFFDTAGATNPGDCACVVRYFGWASKEPEVSLIESDSRDGGRLGRSRRTLKSSNHTLHLSAATKDGLLEGYNALVSYLADGSGKYFEYKLENATDTLYLDFTHAWLDGLPRDADSSVLIEAKVRDVALPLTIVHQPLFRLDEIDAALNKLTNATLWSDENNDGRPNDWTWEVGTAVSAESITNGYYNFTISESTSRSLFQVVTGAVEGDVWTGSFEGYTDDGTNGKARVAVSFLDSGNTPVGSQVSSALIAPSTDPDNPTRHTITTAAAPATTAKVQIFLRVDNDSAAAIGHHWRFTNLSRTSSDPTFRVGVETIHNDPANATAGQRARSFFYDIESDGPVLARLKLEYLAGWQTDTRIAALPLEHPADTYLWGNSRKYQQLESATLGTNTSLVADGTASGSGSNAVETTFATSNDLTFFRTRSTITTNLAGLRGRFLVYARIRGTVALDDFSLKMIWGNSGSGDHHGNIVPFTDTTTTFEDVKLGEINLIDDADAEALDIWLYARRDSGTGNLRWDFLFFVPVYQNCLLTGDVFAGVAGEYILTDPQTNTIARYNSSGAFQKYVPHEVTVPFVLPPGPGAICLFSETGALASNTIKASLIYPPTRHA